jgi:ABC-2 type transport system permease protein
VNRYLQLFWVNLRASLAMAVQYRANFLIQGVMSFFWVGVSLVPLWVLFDERMSVAGWSYGEALVVLGWFVVLRGVLEGAINPSLVDVVDRIRTGSFDYLLLKPADAQFLVSTARFEPWKLIDIATGIGIIVYALAQLQHQPSISELALAGLLLVTAVTVLYSLWILVVSASFWVVRLDNLTYLFSAIFDAGRWPVQVFRGFWRVLFTLVIPLALMTTFPAMALLGTLEARVAALACVGAVVFALLARVIWSYSIRFYTSASS